MMFKVLVINESKQEKTAFYVESFIINERIKQVRVHLGKEVYRYFDYSTIKETDKYDIIIFSETEFAL